MARIPLTVQVLGRANATQTGPPPTPVTIAFTDASPDGHEYTSTGTEQVLIKAGSGSGTFTVVSRPDQFGRSGDQVVALAATEERALGPYLPHANWGDGAGKIYVDPSALAGSVSIAVIRA